MNSCCSQAHDLGKVMGTKMTEAFGLSDVCYIPGLLEPDEVMVDD